MTTLATLIVKLVGDTSGLRQSLEETDGMVRRSSRGLGALGGVLKGGLVVGAGAAVAGIGALGVVLGSSVSEAMAAEEVAAQLNSVLASTQGVAGLTADEVTAMADSLSQVTRFEDDAIVSAQSLLLTFTKIGKDTFPGATEATLDMAQAMEMDLGSAALLVGKALNDPERGMTALTRAGIQFTEEQQETIAALVETGDLAAAQGIILKELNTQFGGSAEAAGKTFAGQLDILKNGLGNVAEEIGGKMIPVLTDMAVKFGPGLIEGADKFADWAVTKLIPTLQDVGNWLETNVPIAIAALKQAWIDAQPTVERIKVIFGDIGEFLGKVYDWLAVNVPLGIDALKQAWLDAQPTVEAIKTIFGDIGEFIGDVVTWLVEKVPPALKTLKDKLIDSNPSVQTLLGLFRDVAGVLADVVMCLAEKIPGAVETVKGAFDGAVGAIQGVVDKIREFVDAILGAIAKLREFLGLGGAFGSGATGYQNSLPGSGGGGYGQTPSGPAGGGGYGQTPSGPAGGGGYGQTPTRGMAAGPIINITIHAPGGDPRAVAEAAQTGVLRAARSMGLA